MTNTKRPRVSRLAIIYADSGCLSLNICKVSDFCGKTEGGGIVHVKLELKLGEQVWMFVQDGVQKLLIVLCLH